MGHGHIMIWKLLGDIKMAMKTMKINLGNIQMEQREKCALVKNQKEGMFCKNSFPILFCKWESCFPVKRQTRLKFICQNHSSLILSFRLFNTSLQYFPGLPCYQIRKISAQQTRFIFSWDTPLGHPCFCMDSFGPGFMNLRNKRDFCIALLQSTKVY